MACGNFGSTKGRVWGNGVYTTDCSLSTAAVHSGALRDGEKGFVRVTILPGQEQYEDATRNGVTSSSWGTWHSSFVVQKTAENHAPTVLEYELERSSGGALPPADDQPATPVIPPPGLPK